MAGREANRPPSRGASAPRKNQSRRAAEKPERRQAPRVRRRNPPSGFARAGSGPCLLRRNQRIIRKRISAEFLRIRQAIARLAHKRPQRAFAARRRNNCDRAGGLSRRRHYCYGWLRRRGRRNGIHCRRRHGIHCRRWRGIGCRRGRRVAASRRRWRVTAISAIGSISVRSIGAITIRPVAAITVRPVAIGFTCRQRGGSENYNRSAEDLPAHSTLHVFRGSTRP